MLKYTILIKLC